MRTRSLGALAVTPPAPRTVVRIPWGRGTENARGLTALACAAVAGVDGFRVGYRASVIVRPGAHTADLAALRGLLCARRARQTADRGWLAGRALHTAAWGESCVDALPDRATADAIPDRDVLGLAEAIAHSARVGGPAAWTPDGLDWRGGLYCGVRDQHRLTVGVQLPWSGRGQAGIAAAWLGQVGAPGVLVRALAERAVPYYAAAAMPVVEHGTECLSVGLSTTAEHVVALVTAVREVLREVVDAGIPEAEVPRLRQRAALYEAVRPPDDLAERRAVGVRGGTPAVAVVGRLTERHVAGLREAVDEW